MIRIKIGKETPTDVTLILYDENENEKEYCIESSAWKIISAMADLYDELSLNYSDYVFINKKEFSLITQRILKTIFHEFDKDIITLKNEDKKDENNIS